MQKILHICSCSGITRRLARSKRGRKRSRKINGSLQVIGNFKANFIFFRRVLKLYRDFREDSGYNIENLRHMQWSVDPRDKHRESCKLN